MGYIKNIINDKSFLSKTLAISIPIAMQNLLSNLLVLVDTMMITSLGETTIAAVGLANKVFFVYSLLLFGICSGSGVLASQYYGKREMINIKRVLRISLMISVGCSILFLLAGVMFPGFVMRIFTPSQNTIKIGITYLTIIAFSYPMTAVTQSYVTILRSMNYVRLPVFITSIAILINILLNYCLIFGNFGFPELGVAGSAIATLIARIFECGVMLFVVYLHKAGDDSIGDFIHTKIEMNSDSKESFIRVSFIKKYLDTAFPVIANEFIWGLGITIYSLVYGRMGDEAVAVTTITSAVENLTLVFFFGICNAAAVILGNELGANQLKRAEEYAHKYMVGLIMLTIFGAMITIAIKNPVIMLFHTSDIVGNAVSQCLTIFALYMPFRMLNCLLIVAVLRSGGDTKAALIIDVSSVWLIGIPMAVLGGLVFKLPVFVVYAMIGSEDLYKLILSFMRYKKKKWLRNITL